MAAERPAGRFRFVVFDWDGTLADSTALIATAIRSACADIGERVPDETTARFVIGLGLADALRHIAPGLPPAGQRALADRYRHHYLAREFDVPLFGGVRELLADLVAAGVPLGVATGKTRKGLDRALAQQALADRFVATRCADEGLPKPHPDMLLHLMERVGAAPRDTLMIGDTTHDLELARAAGASALAVGYGAHPPASLAALEPLATLASVPELAQWLRGNT
jgi:phosphoglycolate phosphatase